MIILDTDHISMLQYRDAPQAFALQACLEVLLEDMATTVITVEEQMRGWLGLMHRYTNVHHQVEYYDRLIRLCAFCADWYVLPFDQHAANMFEQLRQQRVRLGTMDFKIASIALVHAAILLSGNLRDFQQVPGLHVEDWR